MAKTLPRTMRTKPLCSPLSRTLISMPTIITIEKKENQATSAVTTTALSTLNYNVGHISAASFTTPPWMPKPGAPSSRNSFQPFSSPLSFVIPGIDINYNDDNLLSMMTCNESYHEFKTFLTNIDTYPTAKKERCLLSIGSTLNKNNFTFLNLATSENGSSKALNKVFEEIKGKYRHLIFDRVAENTKWLSFDPYGTHVVQKFLTLHNPDATKAIAERLRGNFFSLAMSREGSFVVEKCLNSDFARLKVLEEFRGNDKEWVRTAKDEYGNYVAQKERGMIPNGNKTLQMIQNKIGTI